MKKRITWTLLAVIAAALVIFCVWYTQPMTLEQFCPGIHMSECKGIRIYFSQTPEQGRTPPRSQLSLTPEDPEFAGLLELFQGRTFRRSLLGLLPQGTRTHPNSPGDFQWEVIFQFENVPLGGGNFGSGDILHLNNFYGTLDISFDGETWRAMTDEQKQWIADVMNAVDAVQES